MKKISKYLTGILILLSNAKPAFAQSSKGLGCGGGLGEIGKLLCGVSSIATVGTRLNSVLSGIIGFLTIIAALWFLIQFIIAGYNFINAGGDKGRATEAKEKITNAIVGLLIVVAAWVIVAVIGKLLGLEILNPGGVLESLKIY